MRQLKRWVAVGTLGVALVAAGTAQAQLTLKRITIGSNPSGSVFFLLASGFAKLYQEKLGVRATAQPHAGSSVYLPLIDKGEITLGLNNSMDSGAAYRGTPPFKKPLRHVRALARVWIIPYGFMVKANSGIKSVADLKGKRVVVDQTTIVSLTNLNRAILATAGLSTSDVRALKSGGIVKNIEMVVEGRADAAPVAYSMPAVRKAHASVPGGVRVIPLGPKASDKFLSSRVPGARTFLTKASKRRPYVADKITIAAFDTFLNAGPQISEKDAYTLVKTLYDNWKALQKSYGPLRGVRQSALAPPTNPHPYHPGAIKFYKEVGLWTAANAKQQAAVTR